MDPKKIANNILEFMFDPSVIPVERRLYFRPEEKLQNQAFDKAKAEAFAAYGDQKHNSDFYPSRKKTEREASTMDRKAIIASMDVLSQNFDENDPIGKDLRTMAYAVAHMSDEEYNSRMAKEKDKKCKDCGVNMDKCSCGKAASKEVKDFWTKEASEAVQQAILFDVLGAEEEEEEKEEEEKEEKKEAKKEEVSPSKDTPKEEKKEVPPSKDTPKEEKKEVPPSMDTPKEEKKPPVVEKSSKTEEDNKKIDVEKKPDSVKATAVDTNILAFGDIEMEATGIDQVELTDNDRAQLDKLFK